MGYTIWSVTREKKGRAWFSDGSACYTGITHKQTTTALQPLFRTSLKDRDEKKSSQWAKLYLVIYFGWMKKQLDVWLSWFTGWSLWSYQMVKNLEEVWLENWQRYFGEKYVDRTCYGLYLNVPPKPPMVIGGAFQRSRICAAGTKEGCWGWFMMSFWD